MPARSLLCAGLVLVACTAPPREEDIIELRARFSAEDRPERAPEPPAPTTPECPSGHVAQRLSGALAGLASVSYAGDEATLYGKVDRGATPPSPTELTIIRENGTERTTSFTYKVFPPAQDGSVGYLLEIPLRPARERERAVFVTEACLEIPAPTQLRAWTTFPASGRPIEELQALAAEVRPHLLAKLPPADRAALERFGALRPGFVGELPSTLPGCPRVVVVSNDMGGTLRGGWDHVSALLCIDAAGAVVRSLVAPQRGPAIGEFVVVDLDADGVDELIATISEMSRDVETSRRDELYWWDAATGALRSATLN
ncbi:hypothetical protein [Nannocystis radixulma]|uniref:Lipoprotein n=1 Tax=Nannocystis radixulma TaxID=2995305 RepID=A0ABT5B7F5_9BACT|nr:hypothetical protein [Nannocystis radixulma]MDC0670048.1 hypothetical protein [Nannocystis radixulma]